MKWPTNQVWRKFASRIADGTSLAINAGHIITDKTDKFSPGRECMCPMGAALKMMNVDEPYPTIDVWIDRAGTQDCDLALHFHEAFDGESAPEKRLDENGRAARRLGLWYRKTFVE